MERFQRLKCVYDTVVDKQGSDNQVHNKVILLFKFVTG